MTVRKQYGERDDRRSGAERRHGRVSQQRRLREIVERMADGVIIVDLEGVIQFANPAAEQLFGRAASDLIGTQIGFPAIAGESAEIEIVRPGGEIVAAELRAVDVNWDGASTRLISIRDITDRRRASERSAQLQRERIARAEAEAANQAKSEFLAVMSHELRTPLNAVIGYADLLDLGVGGALAPEQRRYVSRIQTSGRHLLGLVNEVLDLSKVEAGRLTLQVGTARVMETVDAALALVQPIAEARGIKLITRNDAGTAAYEGDEDRVRQILLNLLNNAVKFTEPGGQVSISAGVTQRPDHGARLMTGSWIFFSVSDTGIGIPDDRVATIFDPFVQVEGGHTRPSDGAGLGLTISRRLARLMRGDLTVKSTMGKGSTFTLWLPLATPAAENTARRPADSSDSASRLRGIAEIGEAMIRELEPIMTAFVGRLRDEPLLPRAHALTFAQLADHVATYIADIAAILIAVEESRGEPTGLVADGTDIQRLVAERHGAQRARLGWTTEALRREWRILHEELEAAIRRRTHGLSDTTLTDALGIVRRMTEQSEEISCRSLVRSMREIARSHHGA